MVFWLSAAIEVSRDGDVGGGVEGGGEVKEQPRLEGRGGEKNSQCCGAGRCFRMEGAIVVDLGQEQLVALTTGRGRGEGWWPG